MASEGCIDVDAEGSSDQKPLWPKYFRSHQQGQKSSECLAKEQKMNGDSSNKYEEFSKTQMVQEELLSVYLVK